MIALTQQISQVNTVLQNYDLFQEAYQNNFSIVVSNKNYPKEKYGGNNGELFFGLNKANLNLQKLIGICLDELERDTKYCSSESVIDLRKVYRVWETFTKKGNQFLTYDPAEVLIKGFDLIQYPFHERLDEKSVVKDAFIDLVPEEVKSLIRICIVVSDDYIIPFMEDFLRRLDRNRHFYYFIDRIEIAKQTSISSGQVPFPTFNININPYFLTQVSHPVIIELIEFIKPFIPQMPVNENTYAHYQRVSSNILLCQGFKNYKKFLLLINQADRVYDKETDYAFRIKMFNSN